MTKPCSSCNQTISSIFSTVQDLYNRRWEILSHVKPFPIRDGLARITRIALVLIGTLAILALANKLIHALRGRVSSGRKSIELQEKETSNNKPVPATSSTPKGELSEELKKSLIADYAKLPPNPYDLAPDSGDARQKYLEEHFATAVKPENVQRNRYKNILPHEDNRFKIENNTDFYYNANRVLNGKFLVGQGPLESEILEFWIMILKSGCKSIVMLTNPIEDGKLKCSEYWKPVPPIEGLQIKVNSETEVCKLEGQVIMRREIEVKIGTETFPVTQWQLMNWPDHGVVKPLVLAELIRLFEETHPENEKFLVHCSAGIGRSGAFATAKETASRYQEGNNLQELMHTVATELRAPKTGRAGMIQEKAQYILAYQTTEHLLKGRKLIS